MLTASEIQQLLLLALQANYRAMQTILDIYDSPFSVDYKADESPVTLADREADRIIRDGLAPAGYYVMSEEESPWPFDRRQALSRLWIVDPLDGTKEFVKRNGEFTTNIALVESGVPVLGVVGIPMLQQVYYAARGMGAFRCSAAPVDATFPADALRLPLAGEPRPLRIIGSRSHPHSGTQAYINRVKLQVPEAEIVYGGSSYKLCRIADGTADLYPRFSPINEWDIAAGDALVRYAGGRMEDAQTKKEIFYNKENLVQPPFIAASGKGLQWLSEIK